MTLDPQDEYDLYDIRDLERDPDGDSTEVGAGLCSVCGQPLGANADGGICEECARARNFDELLWEADAQDGALDGEIG